MNEHSGSIEIGSEESRGFVNGSEKGNGKALVTNWRKLFIVAVDQTLSFYPPKKLEEKLVVSSEVFEEGNLQWRNAVVVQFIGKIPNFRLFRKMINMI